MNIVHLTIIINATSYISIFEFSYSLSNKFSFHFVTVLFDHCGLKIMCCVETLQFLTTQVVKQKTLNCVVIFLRYKFSLFFNNSLIFIMNDRKTMSNRIWISMNMSVTVIHNFFPLKLANRKKIS